MACCAAATIVIKLVGLPTVANQMADSYQKLGIGSVQGTLLRAGYLLLGAVMTACMLNLVPVKKSFLSDIGRYSMTIYLAHSFTIKGLEKVFSIFRWSFTSEIVSVVLALVLSAAICLLFGNQWVNRYYQLAMDKISAMVMVKEHTEGAA